jgi:hypothetical protein
VRVVEDRAQSQVDGLRQKPEAVHNMVGTRNSGARSRVPARTGREGHIVAGQPRLVR